MLGVYQYIRGITASILRVGESIKYFSTLKTEAVGSSETLVFFCHIIWHYTLEVHCNLSITAVTTLNFAVLTLFFLRKLPEWNFVLQGYPATKVFNLFIVSYRYNCMNVSHLFLIFKIIFKVRMISTLNLVGSNQIRNLILALI